MGYLCGPFALGIMNSVQVSELGYVNSAALSFIAFSAGAEIYLPEIMPLFSSIMWISLLMIFFTLALGSLATFLLVGSTLIPWIKTHDSCAFGVALLVATILSARSPTSILAVVRELNANGPITHIMIGITVAGDVFVLTIFAIAQSLTFNFCSGLDFDAQTFVVSLAMIPGAAVWGYILGHVMVKLLNFKKLKHFILPIGFFTVLSCQYILRYTTSRHIFGIDIDALLVCITAGYVVGNSPQREKVVKYFKAMSMFVFIPFFTQVGVMLNVPVLLQSFSFAIVASVIRAFCMFLGTTSGGLKVGLPIDRAMRLWIGLMPQAGVSLGLAGIVGESFSHTWGNDFKSTMVAIILVNQIIGPIGAKFLIKYCREDEVGGHDVAGEGLKHTIAAMHDDHEGLHHKEPVTADTQTDSDGFDMSVGKISAPVVDDDSDQAEDDVEMHDTRKRVGRKTTTPGGVEIINLTRINAAPRSAVATSGASILTSIIADNIAQITQNTKDLLGGGGGPAYRSVGTRDNDSGFEDSDTYDGTAAKPAGTMNPLMAVFNIITEKE